MENNECDANHLDVLLPPRKRLLAGMKRQNSDVNSQTPSTSSCSGNEFDTRMNNLVKYHLSSPNLSNDEIVEASRQASIEASKVARAARVVAEEKAAKAAKAVAAAKNALELVATINVETVSQEKYLKKNKMKKHVAVQSLYCKKKVTQNCRTDEELARKLHQVINSSPRISNNTSNTESRSSKLKKLKISPSEKTAIHNEGTALEIDHTFTRNGISGYKDSDDSVMEKYRDKVDFDDRSRPKFDKSNQVNIENGKAGTVLPENRVREGDNGNLGQKKWNIKQKKLPLSICNAKGQEIPKENLNAKSMSSAEDVRRKPGPSVDTVIDGGRTSIWKCQAFKAPACVKQNKVAQRT